MAIAVNAVECLRPVLAEGAAESCTWRINEDYVAHVKQRVLIIDEGVRRSLLMLCIGNHDAARAERAKMKPHSGRTRAAVVNEREGTALGHTAFPEVSRVKHARRGWCLRRIGRRLDAGVRQQLPVKAERGVFGIRCPDGEGACDGFVVNCLPANRDRAFRHRVHLRRRLRHGSRWRGSRGLLVRLFLRDAN